MADADFAEGEVRGRGFGVEWEEKETFNTGKRVTDFYSTNFFAEINRCCYHCRCFTKSILYGAWPNSWKDKSQSQKKGHFT